MDWLDSVEQITPKELEALAETLRASARDATAAAQTSVSDEVILRYDLFAGGTSPSGARPALERAHEQFGERAGQVVERATRTEVSSFAHDIEHLTYGSVLQSLSEPCGVIQSEIVGLGSQGVLIIEPQALLHVMDLLAGGAGGSNQHTLDTWAERGLTASEQRLAARVAALFSTALQRSWASLVPVQIRPIRVETDPRKAIFIDPQEVVVKLPVQLDWGQISGVITLCIPLGALKPIEKKLARAVVDSPLSREADWQTQLNAKIRSVPVTLVAELGTARLTLRKLMSLAPGDVLRLDRDPEGEVVVRMEGKPKLKAKATVVHGNLSLELSFGPADLAHPAAAATPPAPAPPAARIDPSAASASASALGRAGRGAPPMARA